MVPVTIVDGGHTAQTVPSNFNARRIGPEKIEGESRTGGKDAPIHDGLLYPSTCSGDAVRGSPNPGLDRSGRCSAGPLGRGHDVIIAAIKIQGIRRVDLGKAEVACSEEQATSQKMSGRAMHSLHGLG